MPLGSYAASCLVRYILSQSFIDPLLIEYLQAIIYGQRKPLWHRTRSGPVTDVMTITCTFSPAFKLLHPTFQPSKQYLRSSVKAFS